MSNDSEPADGYRDADVTGRAGRAVVIADARHAAAVSVGVKLRANGIGGRGEAAEFVGGISIGRTVGAAELVLGDTAAGT